MTKPLATFNGPGTLRDKLLAYSQQRCDRDPAYRRQVRRALAEKRRRKAEAAKAEEARKAAAQAATA